MGNWCYTSHNWSYNPTYSWFSGAHLVDMEINQQVCFPLYGSFYTHTHMGVSKNSGTPKWMVYKGNPY